MQRPLGTAVDSEATMAKEGRRRDRASMPGEKEEAGRGSGGQRVNESQQESRLNDGKDLISKIHKSAGSQWADKETASKSTFPQQ